MGRTISKWLNALGRAILISIVFLVRRWLPLTLSIVAGVVVAYIMKTASPSIYTSDMVLRSNMIENSQMISYINRLQSLDKKSFAETLGLSEETSKNISGIGAYWIIDLNKDRIPDNVDYKNSHDIYDTTNIRMQDRFDIQVKINTPQALHLLRDGIIKYFNSDQLFQQRNNIRLAQNKEFLERLNIDIENLDSLQRVKYFEETRKRTSQTGGQIVFMQEQNTQLLYNDILGLYYRKQALEAEQDIYKEIVTVLSDFTVPTTRVNGLVYYIRQVIPVILLLTLLILVLFANRKKVNEIYKKYQ
ncbi:MAG TPA: hypothetical protein VMV47_07480 [Bacteroidales bacterium]|nr:hypothetical protein [Bacteroidales bacterium]